MKNWLGIICFCPMIAFADLVLDVRDDDPGFMEMIPESEIDVIKVLHFNNLSSSWISTRNGFSWQAILAGMDTECRTTDRNPCRWPNNQQCEDAGGMKPVGRSFGTPTLPFTPIFTDQAGHQLLYNTRINGQPITVSFSRFACPELHGSDWGDGPWAVTFGEPYNVVCFDVNFENPELMRRQHFKFWRNNNGIVEKVGHQDLVGEPGLENDQSTFCWGSSIPFEAVSTWQDGPGIWWTGIRVGNYALDECERATQKMEEACAVDPLR